MPLDRLSLILFRHGKSDWQVDYGDDDLRRPLSKRGRHAARAMGRFLSGAGQVPAMALTSPALRARDTLELAMKAGSWSCEVALCPALYGDVTDVMGAIAEVSSAIRSLLLVGHQPTWSAAAQVLTGATGIVLPTAAMLRIDFQAERWHDIRKDTAQLIWLVPPRLLSRT